ncbi:MAG: hypothetical protein H0V88_00415 [Pyrinomonadaceae bacterium]|nr:hypothetical protein [Pyrinomonadaceae bacterium]
MSIANELSTDVAVAVLTRPENSTSAPPDSRELSNVVLEVYFTLQRLTLEAKDYRRSQPRFAPTSSPPANGKHASSGH